ncbi:Bud site selection protein 6 [Umbelopsis sp. WA50703]
MGEIEQTVTQLLRTTKSLLEALTSWSQRRVDAAAIHDIYSTLREQFQSASDAFEAEGITISDLRNVPQDLYECVKRTLQEEPSTAVLEQYLPNIRDIIVHLLHGLKIKQALFREKWAAYRQPSVPSRLESTASIRSEADIYPQPRTASLSQQPNLTPTPTSPRFPEPHSPRSIPTGYGQSMQLRDEPTFHSPPTSPRNPGLGLINMPTPNPTPGLSPTWQPESATIENNSAEAGIIRRQLDSQSSLRSRSTVRRRRSQYPGPNESKSSPTIVRDQMGSIGEESETPLSPENSAKTNVALVEEDEVPENVASSTEAAGNQSTEPLNKSIGNRNDDLFCIFRRTDIHEYSSLAPSSLSLYLKMGKTVKKVKYEGEITISALQLLFMDKFSYTSGQQDFPHIYIRDTTANISYELEDVSEVQDKSILSLDLDATADDSRFTNLQGQITSGFEAVNTDISHFRSSIVDTLESFRKQYQEAQSAMLMQGVKTRQEATGDTNTQVQSTSPIHTKLLNDIKIEHENLSQLKQDLAVVRQMHKEFQAESQTMMEKIKQAVKERESTEPAGAITMQTRRSADELKDKLQSSSSAITSRLEDLQDTVDELKLDITQRRCRPSKAQLTHCSTEADALDKEIKELSRAISTAKPIWKKNWEEELQTILKEQQFIKDQESLVVDLEEDHSTLMEVFQQLQKITEIQSIAAPTKRAFYAGPAPEGFEGMNSVMKEVALVDVDSDRRLRALNQAERMRQRDLDNRIDEFEQELTTFVDSKKLKKTGGVEEAERERQRKDKLLLKRLHSNASSKASSENLEDI